MYKVGIIGTGFGTKVHYPAFNAHPDFEVVMIAGRNKEKTERIAKELSIRWTDNWKELVLDEEVDVVAISTPPYLHFEMAEFVLNNNKHLLLEKPTTSNAFEARKLLRKTNGKVAMIAHEFRNLPVRSFMRDLIVKGEIGEVRELHYISYASFASKETSPPFGWLWDEIYDGGFLGALGSHQIDLIRFILGENFKTVQASIYARTTNRMGKNGILHKVSADDGYSIIFTTENGITGNLISTTTLSKAPPSKFVVGGTEGTMYFEGNDIFISKGEDFEKIDIPESYNLDLTLHDSDVRIPPFIKLLDSLSESIKLGVSLAPSLLDGWRNQQVLDAARESNRTGNRIHL